MNYRDEVNVLRQERSRDLNSLNENERTCNVQVRAKMF